MEVFGDLFVVKNYPYEGLEYISKDETHDIHLMIQRKGLFSLQPLFLYLMIANLSPNVILHNHLTVLDPKNIGKAIEQIIDSPT